MPGSGGNSGSQSQADRLEKKVDGLIDAVSQLVLIEERQKQDWRRMDAFDKRLDKVETLAKGTERGLEQWINRGIGAWALAATVFAGLKYWPATHPPEVPRAQAPAPVATATK